MYLYITLSTHNHKKKEAFLFIVHIHSHLIVDSHNKIIIFDKINLSSFQNDVVYRDFFLKKIKLKQRYLDINLKN